MSKFKTGDKIISMTNNFNNYVEGQNTSIIDAGVSDYLLDGNLTYDKDNVDKYFTNSPKEFLLAMCSKYSIVVESYDKTNDVYRMMFLLSNLRARDLEVDYFRIHDLDNNLENDLNRIENIFKIVVFTSMEDILDDTDNLELIWERPDDTIKLSKIEIAKRFNIPLDKLSKIEIVDF